MHSVFSVRGHHFGAAVGFVVVAVELRRNLKHASQEEAEGQGVFVELKMQDLFT
jgi:hypothetical protein